MINVMLIISGWHLAVDKEKQGEAQGRGHFGHRGSMAAGFDLKGVLTTDGKCLKRVKYEKSCCSVLLLTSFLAMLSSAMVL